MNAETRMIVGKLRAIGRELKASELKEGTIVRVVRQSSPLGITAVVLTAGERLVHFRETQTGDEFLTLRAGPDLERLVEKDYRKVRIFVNAGRVKYAATH